MNLSYVFKIFVNILVLLLALSSKCYSQVLSEQTSILVNKLINKPLCYSETNGWSGIFRQYADFNEFEMVATSDELIGLLDHSDKYIKVYALRALPEKPNVDMNSYILKHIYNFDTIICYLHERQRAMYFGDIIIQFGKKFLTNDQVCELDSIIFFSDTKLAYKLLAISENYNSIYRRSFTQQNHLSLLWFAWDNLKIIEPRALDYLSRTNNNRAIGIIKETLAKDFEWNYFNNSYQRNDADSIFSVPKRIQHLFW